MATSLHPFLDKPLTFCFTSPFLAKENFARKGEVIFSDPPILKKSNPPLMTGGCEEVREGRGCQTM